MVYKVLNCLLSFNDRYITIPNENDLVKYPPKDKEPSVLNKLGKYVINFFCIKGN